MTRRVPTHGPLAVLALLFLGHAADLGAQTDRTLLDQYCITCHNQNANVGGLALDGFDLNNVGGEHAEVWETVVRKVKTGMMPPSGARRPERVELDAFAARLEFRLDEAAALDPNPGSPALHRLNRTEYANAIGDLLALDVDPTTLLPADDAAEGFDNIADVLGVSPSLVQGYVSAAMKLSRRAIGDRTLLPARTTYTAPPGLAQDRHIEGLPLGTRGGMSIEHTFPLDAEYEFSVGGGRGAPPVAFTIDGERIEAESYRNFRIPVTAGPHTIGVALVDRVRSAGVDGIYSVYNVGGAVSSLSINGPLDATGTGETPSRQRIFVCYPDGAEQEESCAEEIVATLAQRAFRRPVTGEEITGLMRFYEQGRSQDENSDFETGIQHAVARILVAPRFIYRFEEEPVGLAEGEVYRVSDLELASRLSFFLWSTIPDEALVEVAANGGLSDPAVLEQQVRRMLADPKSDALIDNFASQWLYLRELANVEPESDVFDENLRRSFARETRLLFETILRENRSIIDLLAADYTFVDERLAEHYGIPDIRGSYFRRIVRAEDDPRRGLLGHGSILAATSVANRTSPVNRGKWILENILGTPAPEPPPGVETTLDPDPEAVVPTTLRERMEAHRTNPVCASCHQVMDPIGFALENFDLVGSWRESEDGSPINASGMLVDGTRLNGPSDLREALLDRSEAFVTTATEKMLTYALGRAVDYYDMPSVRSIVRTAADNDYRLSSLILGIVQSMPFQMKARAPGERLEVAAAP